MSETFDVIIIGGGPAGASAALYCARGGLSTCMLHDGSSALLRAERIENFYGAGSLSGAELYDRGLMQARGVGVREINAQVINLRAVEGGFAAVTAAGEYSCRRLIVATGSARRSPDIAGLKQLEGRGVSYCAVCDAFFCRGKRVAVIGAGEYARHEYDTLAAVAGELFLCTNGETACFSAPNTRTAKITGIIPSDSGRVRAVAFADGSELEVSAVFVALGTLGSSAIAKSLGVLTGADGSMLVNADGMTNVPGLYAAGDCTAGIKQVGRAVCDGMRAALAVIKDIKNDR